MKKKLLDVELINVLLSKSVLTSIWHDMQRESHFFKPFTFTEQLKSRGSPHVAKLSVANFLSSVSLFCFFALSVAKV